MVFIDLDISIDKADIRKAVHFTIPEGLESNNQEIERAGRDSLPSTCLIYFWAGDRSVMEQWDRADLFDPDSIRVSVKGRLEYMVVIFLGRRSTIAEAVSSRRYN